MLILQGICMWLKRGLKNYFNLLIVGENIMLDFTMGLHNKGYVVVAHILFCRWVNIIFLVGTMVL